MYFDLTEDDKEVYDLAGFVYRLVINTYQNCFDTGIIDYKVPFQISNTVNSRCARKLFEGVGFSELLKSELISFGIDNNSDLASFISSFKSEIALNYEF